MSLRINAPIGAKVIICDPTSTGNIDYELPVGEAVNDVHLKGESYSQSEIDSGVNLIEEVIPLELLNDWVTYGYHFGLPTFTKKDGIVYVSGLIRYGTGTIGENIAILPVGYRPEKVLILPTVSNNDFGLAYILGGGEIQFKGGSTNWFSMVFNFKAKID